jgi:hypothetical protein
MHYVYLCLLFSELFPIFRRQLSHGIDNRKVTGVIAIPGQRLPRSLTAVSNHTSSASIITQIIPTIAAEPSGPASSAKLNSGTDELHLSKWARLL